MLTAENIKNIKQNNVSANGDLTKQRVKAALKTATKQQKSDMEALAVLKRVSINRVYTTGSISAKIAVAIAQTLNIDPSYLTGEAGERGECTSEALGGFLTAKGYGDLAAIVAKPPRKPRGPAKGKDPAEPAAPAEPKPQAKSENKDSDDAARPLSEMAEEEAVQLLRALYLQSQFKPASKDTLEKIQELLA